LTQFPSLALPELQRQLADPSDASTFERCKLDHTERARHAEAYALHRDLIRLRGEEPVFRAQRAGAVDGAVLSDSAFVLRFFGEDGDDRLLVVNLGRALHLDPAPEPLLAPPAEKRWQTLWSSEHPKYGGLGTPPLDAPEIDRAIPTGNPARERPADNWRIPGECAVVLSPAAPRSNE
jgi:maltooligosyltrehalose trehalohydrolase